MANSANNSHNGVATNGHHHGDARVQVIVNDFLCAHLASRGYDWSPEASGQLSEAIDATNRTRIREALLALGQEYIRSYEDDFNEICARLSDVNPTTAYSIFLSISDELFCEGIKWNHVVTYLIFGAEFALYTVQKGYEQLVQEVAHWMAEYVDGRLGNWISDHGDWEGVIQFAQEKLGQDHAQEDNGQRRFGLKNLICGAAGALGVLTLGLFLTTKS